MAEPDDLSQRRERLKASIQAHEDKEAAERDAASRPGTMSGYAAAFRLSTEFVSALAVGGILGYGLDWLLGTLPLFLVIFFLLGFVAGVLNVLRSAGLIQTPQVGKRPADPKAR